MEAYLKAYAVHAGLVEHIRFGVQVLGVEDRDAGASWSVTYLDAQNSGATTETFDAVVVCNGKEILGNTTGSHPDGTPLAPSFVCMVELVHHQLFLHCLEIRPLQRALCARYSRAFLIPWARHAQPQLSPARGVQESTR